MSPPVGSREFAGRSTLCSDAVATIANDGLAQCPQHFRVMEMKENKY
jgi:hypothetical protein